MKKIFYLLFIMFSFVMGMSYSYADNANVNITTSGYYWNRVYNGVSSSYPFNLYDFNGRVAYCIMPGIPEKSRNKTVCSKLNHHKGKLDHGRHTGKQ